MPRAAIDIPHRKPRGNGKTRKDPEGNEGRRHDLDAKQDEHFGSSGQETLLDGRPEQRRSLPGQRGTDRAPGTVGVISWNSRHGWLIGHMTSVPILAGVTETRRTGVGFPDDPPRPARQLLEITTAWTLQERRGASGGPMRTRQTRTHHSVDDPTHQGHPGPCPDSSNAAQVERKGLGGVSAPPGHEMEGPHAGLLLDSLPLPEAIAAASSWLHNPAVAEWMADRAPVSGMGSITGGLLDALWPAGTTLMLEGDLGGHLFGGLELQAVGSFGRTPDGRLTAAIQTQAGISFIQAIGLQDEDAFGRTRLDERADAAAFLALEVCWDIDGLALGIPRLVALGMTNDPARELGAACAPIILEAAPDVAVTAGVQATASVTNEALEATDLLAPARMLSAPFVDDGAFDLQALVGLTNRIEMLGPSLLEMRAELTGSLDASVCVELSTLTQLLLPDQVPVLAARVEEGASGIVVLGLGAPGSPTDAHLELTQTRGNGVLQASETSIARCPDEIQTLLGLGEAPVERTRSLTRPLQPDEAAQLLPMVLRGIRGLLDVLDTVPGIQHLDSLSILATARVPAEAFEAARDAGLEGLSPDVEFDAILSAAIGGPLPPGADVDAAMQGAARMANPPDLRLTGRIALGAGRAVAAGAGEDIGLTARARTGLDLDHPIPVASNPALLAHLTRSGQSSRRA